MEEIMFDYEPTDNDILEAAKFCSKIHQYCDGCVWEMVHDQGFECQEEFARFINKKHSKTKNLKEVY